MHFELESCANLVEERTVTPGIELFLKEQAETCVSLNLKHI
jgi:hypothetical protein